MPERPRKPYPEFPLNAHKSGQWVKTIRSKKHYFGVWADPDAALEKYLRQKDALHAGRVPREDQGGCTVHDAINEKLHHVQSMVKRGERSQATFERNRSTAKLVVKSLGRDTLIESLTPDDFANLRDALSWKDDGSKRAPNSIQTDINNAKSFFRHALRMEMIDRLPSYGVAFDPPSQKVIRQARKEKGPKMFAHAAVLRILEACTPP